MIKITSRIVPYPIKAITIWPFVIFRNKTLTGDPVLLNHEQIHLEQQKEILVIPFFILYIIQYIINLIKGQCPYLAYKGIAAEKEAFDNEKDLEYLSTRKRYQWIRS
jgi:hypothetical protein